MPDNPQTRKPRYERSFFQDLLMFSRNAVGLSRFHNIHRGKRCFILGNGPSLAGMDLSHLEGEITFGLNRIYLLYEKLGFPTSYVVAVNRYVLEQFSDDYVALPNVRFMNWYQRGFYPETPGLYFLRPGTSETFSKNPIFTGIWEGATVTYVAMQLAYYMGITKVVLIGVDHSFESKGDPHRLVVSDGPDRNHFHPDYFGKGVEWQLPDLETSERAYTMAKAAFQSDGREIIDATVNGKLRVFRKVSFEDVVRPGTTTL